MEIGRHTGPDGAWPEEKRDAVKKRKMCYYVKDILSKGPGHRK